MSTPLPGNHTPVQVAGGDADSVNAYTPLARELVVDLGNLEIRVGDGATQGGVSIPNRRTNDSRYQAKNSELDAFSRFKPTQVGLLVRTGAATYVMRKLVVDTDNLTLTNDDGTSGNLSISFAATIESDHTVNGNWTFNAPLVAAGGVTGDVTGDLLGDVTGNIVGNVDVRGKSLLLDDDQLALVKVSGLTAALAALVIPVGMIVMWAGSIGSIPAGWHLCDGTSSTPDLRNLFILGAGNGTGSTIAPGGTGGTATHTHTVTNAADGSHAHTGLIANTALTTSQIPTHNHQMFSSSGEAGSSPTVGATEIPTKQRTAGGDSDYRIIKAATQTSDLGVTGDAGSGGNHTHGLTVDASSTHTHAATVGAASSTPPFYALAYIMKGA